MRRSKRPTTILRGIVETCPLPEDARNIPYVGEWKYWYREKGMQTSSDDVLVAFLASLWYCKLPVYHVDGESDCVATGSTEGPRRSDYAWIQSLRYLFDNIQERLPLVSSKCDSLTGSGNSFSEYPGSRQVYADLGCGVGSSLLLVAHTLRPALSLGVEVQAQSAALAARSAAEISSLDNCTSPIAVLHMDIRSLCADPPPAHNTDTDHRVDQLLRSLDISSSSSSSGGNFNHTDGSHDSWIRAVEELARSGALTGRCDLLTANPPYLPLTETTRSVPHDSQRRPARFEYHGGVEDYMQVVRRLLTPDTGRCVFSFWAKDTARVQAAVQAAGLRVRVRVDVLGGPYPTATLENGCRNENIATSDDLPYLSVFEVIHTDCSVGATECSKMSVLTLDLRFHRGREATSGSYKAIQSWLKMRPRPLKRVKAAVP